MKRILLMRHAKSSWKDAEIPDKERTLKKRGEKDATRMGKLLREKKLKPDRILCSSAVRAVKTAELLVDKIGYKGEIKYLDKLYMAECAVILKIIKEQPDDVNSIIIIGHNPGLEALLQLLVHKVESLPTAAIAHITTKVDQWSDINKDTKCKLKKIWYPKELK